MSNGGKLCVGHDDAGPARAAPSGGILAGVSCVSQMVRPAWGGMLTRVWSDLQHRTCNTAAAARPVRVLRQRAIAACMLFLPCSLFVLVCYGLQLVMALGIIGLVKCGYALCGYFRSTGACFHRGGFVLSCLAMFGTLFRE